jgi:hypothetical protein
MVTALLVLIAVFTLGSLGWGALRRERTDETARFHRAREITSSWAAPGPRFQTVPAEAGDWTGGRDWTGDDEREDRAG